MILIDTHVLLLGAAGVGDERLGPETTGFLDAHRNDLAWSSMSAWETAMLADKGRISLSMPVSEWVNHMIARIGLSIVPVSTQIAVEAGSLPGGIHGDPGDRILVATARLLDIPFVTADRKILSYAATGYLKTIDARR